MLQNVSIEVAVVVDGERGGVDPFQLDKTLSCKTFKMQRTTVRKRQQRTYLLDVVFAHAAKCNFDMALDHCCAQYY